MFDSYEDIFNRRADSYQRAMRACPRARDAEFAAVVSPLGAAAGGTVFDMPAGGGYLRRHLPAAAHYVAVEPAPVFLAACPEDHRAERIGCSLDAVDRPDGAADAIVSLAGLHHAPDLGAILREMRRLARPGAPIVIADVAAGSAPDHFLNGYVHANSPMGHKGRFFDETTAPAIAAAGLMVIADEVVPTPWRFAGAAEAGGYCADLFGIEGPSTAEVAEALADIVGLERDGDSVMVRWALRRLVCRVA